MRSIPFILKQSLKPYIPPILISAFRNFLGKQNPPTTVPVPNFRRIGSFSQYGEDLIIDQIIQKGHNGFYVDIGAYDPVDFSNTHRFYLKGWNGINIEPQPNRFQTFVQQRKRDINLNTGVYDKEDILTFYRLEIETLSTFNKVKAKESAKRFGCNIKSELKVNVIPLKKILKENLKNDQEIDFISIDTEGNELRILAGNDWDRYRPHLILIEFGENCDEINAYLKDVKYELVFSNNTNGIYLDLKTGEKGRA